MPLERRNAHDAYQVRTGEYPEEQLSVYVTARRYGSLDAGENYVSAMLRLAEICREMVDNYVVEQCAASVTARDCG